MIVMMKADGRAFPAPPPRGNVPAPDRNAPADIQLALRLKVVNRQITKAEHVIDFEAAHIFKTWGSQIHEIEAMGFSMPLYSKNGWDPFIK